MFTVPDLDENAATPFLEELRPGQIATSLFQFLPEILFWIKDKEGRFQFVNQAYCEHLCLSADEIVGKTDFDVHTGELAQVFVSDDMSILRDGKSLLNKSELVTSMAGGIEWRSTSKIALFSRKGDIIGTAGFSRRMKHHEGQPLPGVYRGISRLIEYIHDNISKSISIPELAKEAAMSISTLERHFKSHLNTTPKRFLVRAKIAAGCKRLLNTGMTVAEVAESLGYQEHASFTRAFSNVMHMSPNAYRNFYRGNRDAEILAANHVEEKQGD